MQWIIYFFIALGISLFLSQAFIALCKRKNTPWAGVFYRLGGVAMIASFLITLLLNRSIVITPQILALIIGSIIIVGLGVWDERKNLGWKMQLAGQLLLAGLLLGLGYQIDFITHPLGGVIRLDEWQVGAAGISFSVVSSVLIIGWIVSVMNAINWADGIDGLAGGIGILGCLAIFLVSLRAEVNQPAIAIISIMVIGSLLGFWWFNFPVGKIEAGTTGSYFIGFILATLAIMAGTKIATTLIILTLPLIDALWVIWERKKDGQSVFHKDIKQRHLHYRLRNLGWSDQKILLGYLGFLALMLGASLYVPGRTYKIIVLGLELLCALAIVYYAHKKEKILLTQHTHDTKKTPLEG